MERHTFSYDLEIPYYDCDLQERLRASAALRYMQTAATRQLDSLGLTHARLLDEGFLFVMTAVALRFARAPRAGERIRVATAPAGVQGAHMLRETLLLGPCDEVCAEGQSSWALIEPQGGRLLRPTSFPYALPLMRGEWTPFADPCRLRIRPGELPCGERRVRLSDLDRNLHMNNTVYADILLDGFADEVLAGGGVDMLFLRYRAQARLHDRLALRRGRDGKLHLLSAQIGEKRCFEGAFSLKTP
jgi:medium-chain acyl-[acyl-carrier-protein] hydrolase